MPTPENVLGMSRLDTQLDDVERKLGADPTSGWHTGGYVLIPAIATFGIEGLAVRSASTAVTDVTDVGGSSVRIPVRDLRTDVPLKAVNHTFRGLKVVVTPRPQDAIDTSDLVLPAQRHHILDGEVLPNGRPNGGHRAGSGYTGKSEFPASWSDDRIMDALVDVATDPSSTSRPGHGGDVFFQGARHGVDIEVLVRFDDLWTGYPTSVPRNP